MISNHNEIIEIDGAYGEGGGQVLRTALALSAILGKPFTIHHIRSKRKNPGLQAQHLKAIEAIVKITGAETEGVQFGSQRITFLPKRILHGDYHVEVKTAGSITLILQAILFPLCFAKGNSCLTLIGGTHVPWSPPFHYLTEVLFPILREMGISISVILEKWGFYPKGGGKALLAIQPISELKPIPLIDRGPLIKIYGLSAVSNLPHHIAERQRTQALKRIQKGLNIDAEINLLLHAPSIGQGSFLFLLAKFQNVLAGFSSLGERGKPAERVADEAVNELREYMDAEGCLDPHLADQMVPFLALTPGKSSFTTTKVTDHLVTNLWVASRFLGFEFHQSGDIGQPGRIEMIK